MSVICVDKNFTFDADFLLCLSSFSFLLDKVLKRLFYLYRWYEDTQLVPINWLLVEWLVFSLVSYFYCLMQRLYSSFFQYLFL